MDTKRILIFPAGTEIGMEIHNALKYFKYFELFGASGVDDHSRMIFENYIGNVPFFDDETFIPALNKIVDDNKIDYIFPAHDSVVLKLAENREKLKCDIITSDYYTCDICRSKKKTYDLFPEISPKVFKTIEEITEYPIFMKPDVGQGSQGAVKSKNKEETKFYLNENDTLLMLEYLPGNEYTIDCFTDKDKNLLFCGMRQRIRTRNGISVNAKTIINLDPKILEMANIINDKLNLRGMWFFQVKFDANGEYKLLEIAPRVAGTMCLYRNDGINFPLLSLYDRMNQPIKIIQNKLNIEVDRALTNRFRIDYKYDIVYVDYDDTIYIKNKVNKFLMMFLYQCINDNIKIILLTKHKKDIYESLEKNKISRYIFDEIILLKDTDEKFKYINNNSKAIFIDDSFNERKKINNNCNIPCFDIDMLESLIDWKY